MAATAASWSSRNSWRSAARRWTGGVGGLGAQGRFCFFFFFGGGYFFMWKEMEQLRYFACHVLPSSSRNGCSCTRLFAKQIHKLASYRKSDSEAFLFPTSIATYLPSTALVQVLDEHVTVPFQTLWMRSKTKAPWINGTRPELRWAAPEGQVHHFRPRHSEAWRFSG